MNCIKGKIKCNPIVSNKNMKKYVGGNNLLCFMFSFMKDPWIEHSGISALQRSEHMLLLEKPQRNGIKVIPP